MELKKRSDVHWARKVWHMTTVSLMAFVYAFAPQKVSMTCLIIGLVLFIPADFLRQRSEALNDLLLHLFRPIMRDSETKGLAGTTYLVAGVGIIILFFPREIVLLSMLYLAFADPFASYFGILYGKDKIFGHKSVQGSLAAFLICTLLTALYLHTYGMLTDHLLIVSLLGGLIGCLGELIPFWKLDDNLTLPVFSATFLWLLFTLFGAL